MVQVKFFEAKPPDLVLAINLSGVAGPLYEETVMLVEAESIDEAFNKTEMLAKENHLAYLNINGETVRWSLEQIVDVVPILADVLQNGTEIYTRHFRNLDDYVRFESLVKKGERERR